MFTQSLFLKLKCNTPQWDSTSFSPLFQVGDLLCYWYSTCRNCIRVFLESDPIKINSSSYYKQNFASSSIFFITRMWKPPAFFPAIPWDTAHSQENNLGLPHWKQLRKHLCQVPAELCRLCATVESCWTAVWAVTYSRLLWLVSSPSRQVLKPTTSSSPPWR